ncbi:MAG: excinuclease ABC subunit UvrC [Deltaproteobacteria bacterium]|nr:excinuclease ABC subunit UvrC [Deltaproteobacteria bacterium]
MGHEGKPLRGARLEALLDSLPAKPGVYLMKGSSGRVLYVGKAKNLRSRVRSYFRASGDDRAFVASLDRLLFELEVLVLPSEKDALLVERDLIAQHRPRFNVNLLDDKNFLSLRLTEHEFPRLMVDRRRPRTGTSDGLGKSGRGRAGPAALSGRWFGPYPSATSARQTLRVVQQVFGLRVCADSTLGRRKRPCLLHPIGRCSAPCCDLVSKDDYADQVKGAKRFLSGHAGELIEELELQMRQASAEERFEQAALHRDRMRAVRTTLSKMPFTEGGRLDLDALGLHREGGSGAVVLLQVRQGRVQGVSRFDFDRVEAPAADLMRQFLLQHYGPGADLPPEIVLSSLAWQGAEGEDELNLLADILGERRGAVVRVWLPNRGPHRRLATTAQDNASEAFRARLATSNTMHGRLVRLQARLKLKRFPHRIECFDMSTTGGRLSVGSMAVMIDGEPCPSEYRRFRIREAAPDSDVGMMREVVGRRFRRVQEGVEDGPDLVLLDGGKGQLRVVEGLFADMGVSDVDLAALAKGGPGAGRHRVDRERVFRPGRKNPIALRPESDELFLLSRIRDEAHRFAIAYHRKLRAKASLRTVLEEVPGVGPALRRRLLRDLGSLKMIKQASVSELSEVKGVSRTLAERIRGFLKEVEA